MWRVWFGLVASQAPASVSGTASQRHRILQGLLVGRAAEEIELGCGGICGRRHMKIFRRPMIRPSESCGSVAPR
jgi:hypothetical protein